MIAGLRKLLNIRVGEGRRTALLYTLYFLLTLGSVWGETASEALFINEVGVDSYSLLYITEAVVILVLTVAYTAFVDRVNNARLLAAICIITAISLLITGFWLVPGPAIAFYLFYLIGRATRVLFTVHVWTYISDFYDTRTARRLFPLIGSAGRVSGFLGGLALSFIVRAVHAENIPYIWIGLLVVGAWLTLSIPRWTREKAALSKPQGRAVGMLENFRGGWRAIQESPLLQLLAFSATAMTLLLALLRFQTDFIFAQTYPNADELTAVVSLLKGLANAAALPFQLFWLTRIVNRIGVGWANLFYPVLAVCSYGLLGPFVLLPLAVLGLFVRTAFLWGVRNPIDNMLYNAVPRAVKGRARAFVNGMLIPVATLLAGVILLPVPRGSVLPWHLFALGGVVGLGYLVAAWRTRAAYSQALVETLTAEDADLYRLAGTEWDAADRAALDQVLARLSESADKRPGDAGATIFLAQLAYEIGDRDALPALSQVAAKCGPMVRAAILEIVGGAGLADPQVRQLCTDGLADADPAVRRVALTVLEEQSGPEDLPLLALALDRLHDPDPGVRARAISLLLRSGDLYYLTAAAGALNELLTSDDPTLRALALSTLGEMGDPRFVRTLAPHLADPSESVRRAAALACAAVASTAAPAWVCALALEAAQQALSDPAEAVRLAAVQILARLASSQARPALLTALQDESVRVRESARQVLERMGAEAVDALETLLATESAHAREAAIVALLHLSAEQYRAQADAEIRDALRRTYHNLALVDALSTLDFSGAALAVHTLNDRNQALLDHISRILAALHGRDAIHVIWRNLQASDTRARANAVEALESLTSPRIARLVAPLVSSTDSVKTKDAIAQAWEELHLQPSDPASALETLLTGQDPWLAAIGLYLVSEAGQPGLSLLDTPQLISRTHRQEVIAAALDSPDVLIAETAQHTARQLRLPAAAKEVPTMSETTLSTIEKVIFLKEVSVFSEMTVAQLRALAGIAEEISFEDDAVIFREGDFGDTLYVVVSGRVGLERIAEGKSQSVARLATLESRQYFGEMSIFDQAPRSATAIAIGRPLLLSIRREPLIALVEGDPSLALELIGVLSQRLREANEEIARKTKAAPRQLQKLYDQLM
jgi:CRP-like cAMP-binding protein/HEAT repeat protein